MKSRWVISGFGAAAILAAVFGLLRASKPGLSEKVRSGSTLSHAEALPTDVSSVDSIFSRRKVGLRPIDTSMFLDTARFANAWSSIQPPPVSSGRAIAGLVNHHVLASDLLARFFRGVKVMRPDVQRFIIISPDHYNAGRTDISTHERPYRVEMHTIRIDTTSTRLLTQDGLAATENESMYEREHGIGALIPFLAHEFPKAVVVPISIRSSIDRNRAKLLGARLATMLDEYTFVVVSSDMSHYLHEDVALENDRLTLSWMKTLDLQHFAKATDDYLDTGVSMVALSSMMQSLRVPLKFTLFDHSISSHYGGPKDNTTSYLTGIWSN